MAVRDEGGAACSLCGDQDCIHALDHRAKCLRANAKRGPVAAFGDPILLEIEDGLVTYWYVPKGVPTGVSYRTERALRVRNVWKTE